jgi:hypothetical protein
MTNLMNGGMWNTLPFNGPANLVTIAGDMKVLYNQTSISLDWGTVDGANYYTLQVSLFPDFRSFILNVNITESDYQFTDSSTDDMKRYWRWRPSVSSGSNWLQPWSDIGHYWLDTSAAGEIEVPEHHWTMFDMDDVTDIYWFEMVPLSATVSHNINRFQGRNRLGTLLTEFLTVKDEIQLSYMGEQYLEHPQLDEFERFNNTKRTFFLANYAIGKRGEPTPHIWKVEFTIDPAFAMIAAGRPDLLRGSLTLIEV